MINFAAFSRSTKSSSWFFSRAKRLRCNQEKSEKKSDDTDFSKVGQILHECAAWSASQSVVWTLAMDFLSLRSASMQLRTDGPSFLSDSSTVSIDHMWYCSVFHLVYSMLFAKNLLRLGNVLLYIGLPMKHDIEFLAHKTNSAATGAESY